MVHIKILRSRIRAKITTETSSVEIEGQAEAGSAGVEDDWFESEPEDDENKHH